MLEKIGRVIIKKYHFLLYYLGFVVQVVKEIFLFAKKRKSIGRKVLTFQILFTGVEALSIVILLSLSLGAVIIIQGITLLPQFGQGKLIYTILIIVITRELGPILAAFIVAARSGTAIATEIGNMVVSHEIEAYTSVGINPISYIVVPRVLGVTFSLLLLDIYFNLFGLIGSYFITLFIKPLPFVEYFQNLLSQLRLVDIFSSLIKCLFFGLIIAISSTFNGFRVKLSSTEVPQMAIKAVSHSFILLMIVNAIITALYYS